MTQYHQKKIAMINDLSGYGRCSITAALPVLAALKIQCCPVPTSVLSNHTGFPVYFFDDYTDKMERTFFGKQYTWKLDGKTLTLSGTHNISPLAANYPKNKENYYITIF